MENPRKALQSKEFGLGIIGQRLWIDGGEGVESEEWRKRMPGNEAMMFS